ncbi:murein hydrolase activator EnvC family protein [Alteribacillus bidgolensis]|uniref:N-terminal domain of peptidoglycan hydrolase CwlO-containing protein n=1 Tax=Alteribacillus bidgolensis TaxID=930129 RepID=A0A1G8E6G8_9BACI|nr:M23 family metallopeptidase [Alteribacillus bidgolensis]SDH65229.1 N-terminal domain of peptidoglycan hydrolase CwlO-containing protein [Alteribacillus bidgolensis]
MRKQLVRSLLAFAIIAAGFTYINAENTANASSELRQKLSDLEEKRNSNEAESGETKKEMEELEDDIKEVEKEIRELDGEMTETNEKISEKEGEIEETEERIDELRERIKELEKRIAERDELLKDRVRAMYQNGGSVDYLEVLMGAKSFGDFIDRVSALNTIAEQDREILEAHIKDQEELEEAKEEVEKELASLEDSLEELEDLKEKLEGQREDKNDILGDLEEEEELLEEALLSLEDEEALLKKQEEAAKQELEAYEKRQKEQQKSSSGSSGGSSNASPSDDVPSVNASGELMRPATGSVTSEYGPRWGRMHHGTDIGQGGRSNVPIVAAADGTVVQAKYMNGYGNTVLISHRIDGKQITTLYAHMSSTSVSSGESVSKGDTIGIMGNTGASQGPHLHFEVHEGPWNGAKSNSVNPRKYVDF